MSKIKTFLFKVITPMYDHTQNPKFFKEVADPESIDAELNAFLSEHDVRYVRVTPIISRHGEGSAYDEVYVMYTILYEDEAPDKSRKHLDTVENIGRSVVQGSPVAREAEEILSDKLSVFPFCLEETTSVPVK